MRARVAFAALAVFAALAIVAWGLLPGAPAGLNPAASSRTFGNSAAPSSASGQASASARPHSSSAGPRNATSLTNNMHLVFDASFGGSRLNSSVWDTCYPWASQSAGCTNFNNTKEVEWYLPSQVRVSSGALNLTATQGATSGLSKTGSPKTYSCRSGMVTTHPGFNFEYGYIQVVAHVPNGAGLWPALWLDPSNFSWPPEIDMLEHWGAPRDFSGMFFHPVGAGQVAQPLPRSDHLTTGWHTFAVNWTPSSVTWYLDGTRTFSVTQRIPHEKMFFIANLADYRAGSPCTGTLEIRSVKVWQA